MSSLFKGDSPAIYPATLQLNELRSKLDEEILKRSSFEHQKDIYMDIQRLEYVIKGWMWRSAKQFDRYLQE